MSSGGTVAQAEAARRAEEQRQREEAKRQAEELRKAQERRKAEEAEAKRAEESRRKEAEEAEAKRKAEEAEKEREARAREKAEEEARQQQQTQQDKEQNTQEEQTSQGSEAQQQGEHPSEQEQDTKSAEEEQAQQSGPEPGGSSTQSESCDTAEAQTQDPLERLAEEARQKAAKLRQGVETQEEAGTQRSPGSDDLAAPATTQNEVEEDGRKEAAFLISSSVLPKPEFRLQLSSSRTIPASCPCKQFRLHRLRNFVFAPPPFGKRDPVCRVNEHLDAFGQNSVQKTQFGPNVGPEDEIRPRRRNSYEPLPSRARLQCFTGRRGLGRDREGTSREWQGRDCKGLGGTGRDWEGRDWEGRDWEGTGRDCERTALFTGGGGGGAGHIGFAFLLLQNHV